MLASSETSLNNPLSSLLSWVRPLKRQLAASVTLLFTVLTEIEDNLN